MRKRLGIVAALAAVTLVAAGCGGGSSAAGSDGGSGSVATITASTLPSLGTVLVNGKGYTLYMFPPDHHDGVSCTGACAGSWPPVTVPDGKSPKIGPQIEQSLVDTVQNPNPQGGQVATYNGWPLYTYAADAHPGEATGQALDVNGGLWYVMRPSGKIVKTNPSGAGS
jgi:predicted lipoprotein with Yx(FWY)xxD motif